MILLIDSYDSFTNNLSCLIEKSTNKSVIVLHNDTIEPNNYDAFLNEYIDFIDYIILGPGPGLPVNPSDVGITNWLFDEFKKNPSKAVPIFGICLGFQCLCFKFDNEVKELSNVKHGQVYEVFPIVEDEPLFEGQFQQPLPSVRYHSLYVDINTLNSEIIPLAVCYEENGGEKEQILMSGKHASLPFYGVQYHPESICTENGAVLVQNFDKIAEAYNIEFRPQLSHMEDVEKIKNLRVKVEETALVEGPYVSHDDIHVFATEIDFNGSDVSAIDICDALVAKTNESDFILLNSASAPGDWSIIGIPTIGVSEIITHSMDNMKQARVKKYKLSNNEEIVELQLPQGIWNLIAERFADSYVSRDTLQSKLQLQPDRPFPFYGGYMGLMSYEEGKHVIIEKLKSYCNKETPDLKLIYIERFVLFDHLNRRWYVASVSRDKDDSEWCLSFKEEFEKLNFDSQLSGRGITNRNIKDLIGKDDEIHISLPDEAIYKQQFEQCQKFLHSGNSYELCLTTPLKIYIPEALNSWDIYKILVNKNPAPFSCFMDFDDVVLLSSSPERFLDWKGDKEKAVELRPVKGTVQNTPDMTLERATEILRTPKEMGENLMIVDLIRHDLHQFIHNVEVSKLMVVEQYKSVFQLVSYIRGALDDDKYHGIDILHSSLPPGSMTGAPKKRSVELLQDIEQLQPNGLKGGRRGIYSGVVGYWSVTDDSDWSVVIRSMYHYNDDVENSSATKVWRIGAGGAITVLSNAEDEWNEMTVKLKSALQAFQ